MNTASAPQLSGNRATAALRSVPEQLALNGLAVTLADEQARFPARHTDGWERRGPLQILRRRLYLHRIS